MFYFDGDQRHTGAGKRLDIINLGHLLDSEFKPVGQFQLHLFRACTGIECCNNCRLHREFRIFELAETEEGTYSGQNEQNNDEITHRPFFNGNRSKAHSVTSSAEEDRMRTCWPSFR